MFGHSKEIKDLYTAYSEKVQLQEDKKDKKEKGIGLEGSINVPGLGKTIETRKKNIKSELTDKDKDDDKKEKELEFVVNKSKKGDYKKIESDSKSNKGNNTLVSLSGSKDSKDDDKVGGSTTSGTIKQQDHHQSKVIAQFKKEQESKKQKEASDDEKGANEWGPGGQPSASKQIDAYKKGRPSPASFKTNQRQTRELIKKQSKEVYPSVTKQDLNQFNRTKKYSADDGSQVERSTVFTKHYKTGKPLGVMTGSQRKAYDKAAAAYKAQPTPTPKPEKVPAVDTKPDTYKTNIGAFLNNKKKGDVKDKSRHTKVTSVMDMMDSYDDKGEVLANESSMAIGLATRAGSALAKGAAKGAAKRLAPDAPNKAPKSEAPDAPVKAPKPKAPDAPDKAPKSKAPDAPVKAPRRAPMRQESYDAYDLVLDYIMESNQASSIEEANYIMMEMDQNTIHEIVQAQKKNFR